MYDEIIFNLETVSVEEVVLEGRPHFKVPAVGITEGVHEGTKGKILYLSEDGEKDPGAWNHKPAIIYHPKMNGRKITAADEQVINNQKVGYPLDSRWEDGKLKMSVYLDKERLKEISDTVYTAIVNKQPVEVSTGLGAKVDWKKGEWNGEAYDGIARNWRPDHLAILPDQKGACGLDKGAGLLQNEAKDQQIQNQLSFDDIRSQVCSLLYQKFQKPGYSWNGWISDVYDGYVIYYEEGDYYQQNFTITKDVVALNGDPVKVVRKTVYESISNKQLVGEAAGQHFTKEEFLKMTKKDKVNAIIENKDNEFGEADRDFLMNMEEPRLDKMVKVKTVEVEVKVEKKKEEPVKKEETAIENRQGGMSDEDRQILNRAKARENKEKKGFIDTIMNAKSNKFKREYLENKDFDELEAMAALITPEPKEEDVQNSRGASGIFLGANRFLPASGGPGPRDEDDPILNADAEVLHTEEFEDASEDYDFEDNDDEDEPVTKKKTKARK
jgi:hypothetical protein